MIMIIATEEKTIFGAFCTKMIMLDHQETYYGGKDSIIFMAANEVLYSCQEYFCFGNDQPAFQLDSNLLNGYTHRSQTFQNIPFNNQENYSRFKCNCIEVYALQ
eukprot:TRINITY_DN8257_c0_g1_i1.p3 TRINITY_DN8257_c0_g1~~TRINITY_DN8257_c0_g1_i1.p3  ORF type:complete len:104 (-),score=17.66 TRINITY_DN8257_c0_g1_i1:52-363(-)